MKAGKGAARRERARSASVARRRPGRSGGIGRLEGLEPRSLLTIYNPVGVTLAPSPVEGTAFAGATVGTFATTSPIANLSATIIWGPSASPGASIGTINLVGSEFVPGVGDVPQYMVTGGTTYAEETGASSLPIVVSIGDSTDGTNAFITSSTTVADAPLTVTGGISTATVVQGASVNYTGAISLMTFIDGNPNATPADFSASISWGDGTPASAGTISKAGATFTVAASHTYTRQTTSPFTAIVTVTDVGGATVSRSTAFTVNDAALSTPAGIPVDATAGQMLSNVALGTFLDGNPYATAADYNVTIDWGDGTSTPGFATVVGGTSSNARVAVSGTHTYADNSDSPYTVTATINEAGGQSTTITTTATVAPAPGAGVPGPLSVSVPSIIATAATPVPSQVVATFFDPGGDDPVGNFTASVSWGDGTSDDLSTGVAISAVPGQPGMFSVTAPGHTYARPGLYPITVSVGDSDPNSGSGNGSALVAAAPLVAAGAGPIGGVVEGQPLPAMTRVASFIVQDPAAQAGGFVATIDWGDGSPQTTGAIFPSSGDAVSTTFDVLGNHTYAREAPGGYNVTVSITDASRNTVVATTLVPSVADAPLTGGNALPVSSAVRQMLASVPLATFVDGNPNATPADFAATIDWGDDSDPDPNAQVVLVGGSASGAVFAVYGSHTYANAGAYTIGVDVADRGGSGISIRPASPNATVAETDLSVNVLAQAATAGSAIPAGTLLGTFLDLAGADPNGNYTAAIDWGDGSAPNAAIITPIGGSAFRVDSAAGHTYASPGNFALRLIVANGAATGLGGSLAAVAAPPAAPPVLGPASPIFAIEGSPFPGVVVATFTDSNPGATGAGYSATIDWGDGSPMSVGSIVPAGLPGSFLILGDHTFGAAGGPFAVNVVLTSPASGQFTTTTLVNVVDASLGAPASLPVRATKGTPLANVPVATFVDANPNATPADFTASIDWGDDSDPDPNAQVVLVGGSASGAIFAVYGSHLYNAAGAYSINVSVADKDGSALAINPASPNASVAEVDLSVTAFPVAATAGTAIPAGTAVGTVLDLAGPYAGGIYGATIDWGDGSAPDSASLTLIGGSAYRISTSTAHTYASAGAFMVTLSVDHGPVSGVAGGLATVAAPPAVPPVLTAGAPIVATEGSPVSGALVATFTDAGPAASLASFHAIIDWGDGTPASVGLITPGAANGSYDIRGSHTYADEGGPFTVTVLLTDAATGQLSVATTATVSDAALTGLVGIPVAALEDAPISHAPLGTFNDANRSATPADFAASIDWGDGTTSAGAVRLIGGSASGAVFGVSGGHTYADPGMYAVVVTVNDLGGSAVTITTLATVAAAPVVASPAAPVVATAGSATPSGLLLATFTSGNGADPTSHYTATIDWGDGSAPAAGSVVMAGSGYNVLAPAHTFAKEGMYGVRVTIADSDSPASPALASGLALVKGAPMSAVSVGPVSGTAGVAISGVAVGSFADGNPAAGAADFVATIDWGDGSSSPGLVTQPGGAGTPFVVVGSHTYAASLVSGGTAQFQIAVAVDAGSRRMRLDNTASIAAAPVPAPPPVAPVTIAAALDPSSDRGASNADGITNDNTPRILGTTAPNATVALMVSSPAGNAVVGMGVADATGHFAVDVAQPLADGTYTVTAIALNAAGYPVASAALAKPLVIDTVGPRVAGVQFDRVHGRLLVSLADDASGLDQAALLDGANYHFAATSAARRATHYVTSLAATTANAPTDAQTVTVAIDNGRYLPGGRYRLTVDSAGGSGTATGNGLRDVAGNALDGEFYGSFSSGNGKAGGDFVAGLDAARRTIFAAAPAANGFAAPAGQRGTKATPKKIPAVNPTKLSARVAPHGPAHAFVKSTVRGH